MNDDLISRQAAIDALWKALYEYEDKTEKQFQESEDLDIGDWIEHRIFVQNMSDIDRKTIMELPSAQPEPHWIPCGERLPEDGATVWVTIKGHDVIRCEDGETLEQAIERINKIRWVTQGYWSEEEHGWNDPSYGCPLIVQPIAWMPIDTPEPYKEGQE